MSTFVKRVCEVFFKKRTEGNALICEKVACVAALKGREKGKGARRRKNQEGGWLGVFHVFHHFHGRTKRIRFCKPPPPPQKKCVRIKNP